MGLEARFDFVRFVTVVESNDGLGTRKFMCTPNVSKINVDNGNEKRFGAFLFQLRFARRGGRGRPSPSFYGVEKKQKQIDCWFLVPIVF